LKRNERKKKWKESNKKRKEKCAKECIEGKV
jgi:hypothetical protein